jgi:transcriptional regulator with XRE-family HTH domain
MENTLKRIKNTETLTRFGKVLRQQREQLGIAQGKVRGMRQATVSKIENGGDVNLDTLITYAGALGFELALVPIGQGSLPSITSTAYNKPKDLISEFSDLKDDNA